jgi:hypothetical protein
MAMTDQNGVGAITIGSNNPYLVVVQLNKDAILEVKIMNSLSLFSKL